MRDNTLSVNQARNMQPHHLRIVLLRRLRLKLRLDTKRCKCGETVNVEEDHRCACSSVGKLVQRAKPLKRTWARVCREAGARILKNQALRDFDLEEAVEDDWRLEVLADNLPLWSGAQLVLDAKLVSSVYRDGTSYPQAARENGVRPTATRQRKEDKYSELLRTRRCRLIVAAMKIRGRWPEEVWTFLTVLAKAKAETVIPHYGAQLNTASLRKSSAMLTVATQTTLDAIPEFASGEFISSLRRHRNRLSYNRPTSVRRPFTDLSSTFHCRLRAL